MEGCIGKIPFNKLPLSVCFEGIGNDFGLFVVGLHMFGFVIELPPPCFEFYFDSSLDFSENDVTLGEKARWGYVLDFQGREKTGIMARACSFLFYWWCLNKCVS